MSADELKAQGNAAFAAKDYEKAIGFFTQAIEVAPTNHVLYSNRSASFASLKQFDKAFQDAQKTIEINPTWAKGYSRVAAAEHGLGKLDNAEKSYQKALELDSSNKQAQDGLRSVQSAKASASGPGPDLGLGKLFNDPNLIENLKKNPKTAELMKDPSLVDKVIRMRSNPQAGAQEMISDPRLMTVMATLLGVDLNDDSPVGAQANAANSTPSSSSSSSQEKPKESEPTPEPKKQKQEETKTEEPKDKDGDVKVDDAPQDSSNKIKADESKAEGNKLYKARKFDEAIAKYNEAFELHSDVTYLNNRAAAEFEKGDYEQTIKTCQEAIEKGREQRADYKIIAKSFARIGTTYLKQEDYPSAINFFEKSLTEHRTPEVLTKLRSTQKLIKEAETKAYINPEKAEEARLQGKDFFTKGDWPNAVKAYTEMVKRAPEDARGYSNRAAALAKLMSFPEAVKDAEKAVQLDPTFIRAYIRKASAEIALKDFSKAIETLDLARSKDLEVTKGTNAREIDQLYSKAYSQRFQGSDNETPEQTLERASKDPEVAAILQDPVMNSILSQARENPQALQEHMKNPEVAKKVQVLVAAGIIRTR